MSTITILGAGAMGSGLCRPLVESGWEVRLWGTWLDDHLLDACESSSPHPRTQQILPKQVRLFCSAELEKRQIELLPDAIRRIAKKAGYGEQLPPIVAIAEPAKANECAAVKPTATIFACKDRSVAVKYAKLARNENYCIEASDDEIGVELCAPMKNVYAIALGICDGLEAATGIPHHNLKAATFNQAVKEMSRLGSHLGAQAQTAFELPGVGDLEVTGLSGRNKLYGVRIGKGQSAQTALADMERLEQTVEGIPAAGLAAHLVAQKPVVLPCSYHC